MILLPSSSIVTVPFHLVSHLSLPTQTTDYMRSYASVCVCVLTCRVQIQWICMCVCIKCVIHCMVLEKLFLRSENVLPNGAVFMVTKLNKFERYCS